MRIIQLMKAKGSDDQPSNREVLGLVYNERLLVVIKRQKVWLPFTIKPRARYKGG